MTDEQRVIGRLEAEIESLNKQMERQETQNKQIMEDVREIRETLASAKGSWKTLIVVAGMAGTAGAFISKLTPFFSHLSK